MVTPLARRRPWTVAREVTTLDHLSGGRMVLGVGLGVHPVEFDALGEEADPRARAAMLEESLELLRAFWAGQPVSFAGQHYTVDGVVQQPTPLQDHVPIWVAGVWPNRKPMQRAARFDDAFPITDGGMTPQDFRDVAAFVAEHREDPTPLEMVHEGTSAAGEDLSAHADAGVTWWLERCRPEDRSPQETWDRVLAGPWQA